MGEIKSTLDLVMERTRHLSLSSEEKKRQQKEAFKKRLNGLLANFADGSLTVDALQNRISQLQKKLKVDDRKIVLSAIGERIDPGGDNRHWLQFFKGYCANRGFPSSFYSGRDDGQNDQI